MKERGDTLTQPLEAVQTKSGDLVIQPSVPTTLWQKVWMENYLGKSEIAQSINTKDTYKKDKYLPWATMERVLMMLDPDSRIEILETPEGGLVFTQIFSLPVRNKEGDTYDQIMVSHFVKVVIHFMGKRFEEPFPVQDNSYLPVRFYEQNLVNKAIQRAKARGISRATGVGFQLYEKGDLQYEADAPNTIAEQPSTPKPAPAAKTKPAAADAPTASDAATPPAEAAQADTQSYTKQLFDILQDENINAEAKTKMLNFVNSNLKRTYQVELTSAMSLEEVDKIVALVAKPEVLLKSIRTQLGLTNA